MKQVKVCLFGDLVNHKCTLLWLHKFTPSLSFWTKVWLNCHICKLPYQHTKNMQLTYIMALLEALQQWLNNWIIRFSREASWKLKSWSFLSFKNCNTTYLLFRIKNVQRQKMWLVSKWPVQIKLAGQSWGLVSSLVCTIHHMSMCFCLGYHPHTETSTPINNTQLSHNNFV